MVYWHIIVSGDWTEACKLCLRALFRINLRSESLIAQLINTRVWNSLEVAAQAALGKTPAAGDRQTNFSPSVFAALMNRRNENVQCHDYCHLSWIRSWNGKVITKLVDDWGCCVHFSLLFFFWSCSELLGHVLLLYVLLMWVHQHLTILRVLTEG